MHTPGRLPIRFSLLTVFVWVVVAGGIIFLLWQVINRISTSNLPISTANPDPTQVHQTIAAMLTPQRTIPAATATHTTTPSAVVRLTPFTNTPVPSQDGTSTPQAILQTTTPTIPCDRAAAGNPIDVTIPDDSLLEPGQSFVKTWKLVNDGSCTWTAAYSASFFYGDRMQAPKSVALNESVLPAHSVEISIDMVAPEKAGTYQGNWKLSDPSGELFGIGPGGDAPFWVRIVVPERPADTTTPTESLTTTPAATATEGTPTTPSPTGSVTATPATTSSPPIQASGLLSPFPGDSIDLDSLVITGEDEDLKYQVDANNYHWLAPEEDARIGIYGSLEPGFTDCQSASMSQAPIAVESLSIGTYLCYVTHEGRYGRAQYVSLDEVNYSLTLDLLTWAHP